MGNIRALFASAGVSAALVAAAAAALLAVSAVFAFGGRGVDLVTAASRPALVLDVTAGSNSTLALPSSQRASANPLVLRARMRPPALRRTRPATPQAEPAVVGAAETYAAVRPIIRTPAAVVVAPPAPQDVATVKPRSGDAVRRAGDGLSSAVQNTATTLSDSTAPLGPPVSEAVQNVLDQLAILLQRTTNGVGGTLDKLLAPKK